MFEEDDINTRAALSVLSHATGFQWFTDLWSSWRLSPPNRPMLKQVTPVKRHDGGSGSRLAPWEK